MSTAIRSVVLAALLATGCANGKLTGSARIDGAAGTVTVTLTGASVERTTADSSGAYAFGGLADGDYVVTASAPSTKETSLQTAVKVTHGKGSAPELVLTPVGTIAGKATLGGATTGNGGILVFVGGSDATAFTDDGGNYVLHGVRVGGTKVSAAKAGFATVSSDNLSVGYGQSVTAGDLSLVPGSSGVGGVTGAVRLLGQTDFGGTTVSLAGTTFTTTTASSGSFALSGVPTGVYPLSFVNGNFVDTIPAVQVVAGAGGFVADDSDGVVYALTSIEIPQARRLASAVSNPVVSPDGTQLLFTGRQHEVQIEPVAGGTVTTLSTSVPYRPGLSQPTYQFLASSSNVLLRTADGVLELVPQTGGAATVIAGNVSRFMISPDRQWILFIGDGALKLAPIAGGAPTTVGAVASDWQYWRPFFSDDGKGVVFRDGTSYSLMYWPIKGGAGGTPTKLADNVGEITPVPGANEVLFIHTIPPAQQGQPYTTWLSVVNLAAPGTTKDLVQDIYTYGVTFVVAPNHHDLAYVSNAGGVFSIKGIHGFDGNSPTTVQVSQAGENPNAFFFSPDSANVIYSVFPSKIEVAPAAGSATPAPRVLSTPGHSTGGLRLSPDGKFALWTESVTQVENAIVAASLSTTIDQMSAKQLTGGLPDYYDLTTQGVFSPTEAKMLAVVDVRTTFNGGIEVNRYGVGSLVALSLDGSKRATLASNAMTDQDYGLSPDGKNVYFHTPAPDDVIDVNQGTHSVNPTLYVVPGAGGLPQPVLGRTTGATVWADGSTFVGVRAGSPKPFTFQDGIYVAKVH